MKNKESIKIIILVGLMVIVLVALGAFFSFAYFAADTDINNTLPLDVSIEDGIPLNFTATGNDDITVNVSGDSMLNDSIGSVAGTGNTSITLSLDTTMNAFCTYDLVWKWDSTSPNQYTKTNSSSNEFTISGTDGTQSLSETQVSNYNNTLKLGTYTIEANNAVATQTWNFSAKFYNINANQDAHAGAIYKGKIVVENAMCEKAGTGNTLSDTVLALADGSERESGQTNGGVYRVINPEVNVPSPTIYTKLTQSEYGNVTEYLGTAKDTLPSGGTTLSERVFDYNSSDNTYSNDVTNMATSSYYHMVVPVEENASYQICYKVTTAGATNYLYAYITDETSSYSGYSVFSKVLSSVGTNYTCTNLGYLTEGQGIRIINRTYTTIAAVTFYLRKSTEMTSNGNAGVRYQGKDPNNYVQFNGTELWRIIGVFEGSTIGLEEGKYYTKIIKNESIGNKYWNETNYENNWVNASLNTYLTNTYYLSINEESKGMIAQDVTYYLGGAPSAASNTYTPAQFYKAERGNTGGAAAPTVVTHQNEIGLMYPSDYGYAMYDGSGKCSTDLVIYNYSTSYLKCANYDWMFLKANEWTISPFAGDSIFAFGVSSVGNVNRVNVGLDKREVRPVLYLEASVGIESGEGTLGSPYILK